MTVHGVHYSNTAGLESIDGSKYGTNHKGAEHKRLSEDATDKRFKPLWNRVYFYPTDAAIAEKGESMVGRAEKYEQTLGNIYDGRADHLDLMAKAQKQSQQKWTNIANEFELLVTKSGFDGYRNDDMVVVLGVKDGVPIKKAMRKRTDATKAAYEARIDELFAGGKAQSGTVVLDSTDVLAMLGHGEEPLILNEAHLIEGMPRGKNFHPEMTAALWKRVPDWIDNPVVVYKSRDQKHPNRLTMIGPELIDGSPVVIALDPKASATGYSGSKSIQLLVTVFAKNSGGSPPYAAMVREDLIQYIDTKNAPDFWRRGGYQFPSQAALSPGRRKILTEKNMGGYRKSLAMRKRSGASNAFTGYTIPTERFTQAVASVHGSAIREYIEGIKATGRKFRRVFQDDLYPLKTVEDHIKKIGNYDDGLTNTYQRAELYYGRAGNRIEEFKRTHVKPLMHALAKSDVTIEELEQYLYARFAPVRNKKIFEQNLDRANAADFIDGKSGMTNQEANDILEAFDAAGKTNELATLADMVYAMNAFRIDLSEAAGLLTKEQADEWRNEATYVPLKGFADGRDIGFDVGGATGKGFSVSRAESKRAKGRDSRAADLIENVIAQAEQTIIRAEKNSVAQSFIMLVLANPNEALWKIERRKVRLIRDPATGELVETSEGNPVIVSQSPTDHSPNVFIAKVDGKEVAISLRGEGGEQLATAMKNMGAANLGTFLQFMRGIGRWLSMTRTTLNPEFVVANFARDIQTAMANLSAEEGVKLARATANPKTLRSAMAAIWRWEREKPGNSEMDRWYEEFRRNGAKTDYANQRSLEEIQADLREMISAERGDAGTIIRTKAGLKKLMGTIEAANAAVENATRLSAYVAARKAGADEKTAASLAKNLTVNFNRRGTAGPVLNSLYLFANASIQGNARFVKFVAKNPKAAMLGFALPTFLLGFTMSMVNSISGGDDDDGEDRWGKVKDWERDRNLIMMVGETKLKVPLPYTYNLPYIIGSRMADIARGDAKVSTAMAAIGLNLINSFNPLGDVSSAANVLAPTVLDPFVDLERNLNFFGSPIRPENTFEPFPLPDSQKSWETTPAAYKAMAEVLNSATGGDEVRSGAIDVSPTTFQYWVDFWGGGTAGFLDRAWGLIEKPAFQDKALTANDVPFVRAVVGTSSDRQVSSDYYAFKEDAAARSERLELDQAQGLVATATGEARRSYGLTAALAANAKSAEGRLRRLRKQRKLAKEQGNEALVKQIEEEMQRAQALFNKTYVGIMGQLGEPVR